MAFDPSTATEATVAKKPKFDPSTVKTEVSEEKQEPTLLERGTRVAREGLTGGIFGAAAPEMMQATGQGVKRVGQAMGPYGRIPTAVGGALELGGQAMKTARPASFVAGTIGGLTGETAGQVVESQYGPGLGAETARLLGATLGPLPIEALGTKTGQLFGTLAGKFIPGMSTAKTVGQLLQEQNIKPQSLTKEQQEFIAKKIADIRGGKPSIDAEKEIVDMLKSGAQQIVQRGEMTAAQIERDAASRSQQTIQQAQERAQKIRESARASSPQMRQISEADAQAILKQGQAEAQRIQQEATKKVADLRGKAGKLTTRAEAGQAEAQKTLQAVGEPKTPTQTGTDIRDAVTPVFENLKAVRDANAKISKSEAFSAALAKEREGKKVENTEAFDKAVKAIDAAITNPETKLTNVSIDAVKSQLSQVKRALDPRVLDQATGNVIGKPVSFEGLENLRRFLRDRAYGLPAEGFDAIGQRQAGELADAVEAIQKEFSPSISKFLQQYKADSEPLRIFKTKLGQALVGKEEFDMTRFATDPAELADKFFKSETGVKDLMQLLGKDFVSVIGKDVKNAEQIARGYVASKLEGATGKDVENFLSKNKDWINQFPDLRQQLETAAKAMSRAAGFGGARTSLAQALRTEAGALPTSAAREAESVLTKAGKEAQRAAQERIKGAATGLKGEKKLAAGVVKGAEAEAADIATAAKTQAGQVRTESQNRANTILKGTTDADRVRQIILGTDDAAWKETANIVLSSPGGKEKFADAVNQILADKAASSLKGAIDDWKYIGQRLIDNNLMSPQKVAETQAKLQEIFVAPVDLRQKSTMVQRLMRNAITGYIAPATARLVD
jgi:hypothetical protein